MPTINEWITRELLVAQLTKLSEIIQLRDRRHRTEKSGKTGILFHLLPPLSHSQGSPNPQEQIFKG